MFSPEELNAAQRQRITSEHAMRNEAEKVQAALARQPSPPAKLGKHGRHFICPNPNCDFTGVVSGERDGKLWLMIALLLLWVLPGIIYAIFTSGYIWTCPKCNLQLARVRG